VLKVLGHGGMGIVFQAEDATLQRPVALKTLHANHAADATARQRFLQEARSAAAVDHENVVTIYGVSEENGIPYLAMQFLQGRSLEQKLRIEKQLPTREILRIGQEIAHGLAAAHKLRLVHRDIKPSNIWLTAEHDPRLTIPTDGRVKILDFGLARAMEQKGQGLTQQGLVVGTAGYMSPEQARGNAIDARADLYSLGCVLYEMGTGRLPLEGSDPISTLMATMLDIPETPLVFNPSLPTPLAELILKLLAKNPDQRPSAAASVAQQLARLAQGSTSTLDQLRARLLGGKK
jgi:eukaryotic-like serine/threonine-protein kinase